MFVNGEDCALMSADKSAGRRGLCGTMFVFKIAGAMAEAGQSLETITETIKMVSSNMGTMGLALGPCSLPGQGPLFTVAEDKIEIGLGVHGEAGVGSVNLCSASEAVKRLLDHMTNKESNTRLELRPGEKLAVILNNLGGTSKLEELVLARELVTQLEARGHTVVRMYTGHMMTSLEMAGILISLLRVTDHPEWLEHLDAPTEAPAWPKVLNAANMRDRHTPRRLPAPDTQAQMVSRGASLSGEGAARVKLVLETLTEDLISLEDKLNLLDSGSGDGDCGSTLAAGAKAVKAALPGLSLAHPLALLQELASLAEAMGGSSGGIYSILLTSAASAFQDRASVEAGDWVQALRLGLEAVMLYGGAAPGDRTMVTTTNKQTMCLISLHFLFQIDALHPALVVLEGSVSKLSCDTAGVLAEAITAARQGAEATKTMKAQAGRASYVAADKVVNEDPGAVAAAAWFSALGKIVS